MSENRLHFQILRSDRKKIAIQILPDGTVLVRAPLHVPEADICALVKEQSAWILRSQAKLKAKSDMRAQLPPLTMEDIRKLADRAMEVLPARVAYFASHIGVTYGRITIRNQKGRWGSCSSQGNLNFNCLLMLTPPHVIDYVIVHELCHLKELNHSDAFWAEVKRILPDYEIAYRWLKANGGDLIARMKNGGEA